MTPQDDNRHQSSRRGFLRIIGQLAPAVGLAVAPAIAAPLDGAPSRDPALLALCTRVREARKDFQLAIDAFGAARDVFLDQRGPIPEAIQIKGGDVLTSAKLREIASGHPANSTQGRRVRRQLKIAQAYGARHDAAAEASGIRAADKRLLVTKDDVLRALDERDRFIASYGLRQEEAA